MTRDDLTHLSGDDLEREGWLAAETPEPPSTRKPKATRRAPSR